MFSIFKRNNNKTEVPNWASFFDEKEYAEFLKTIDKYFKEKNIHYVHDDDFINVEVNDFGFNKMGLTNVAQVCKQNDTNQYKKIVSEHFDSMTRAHKFDSEFEELVGQYEKIEQYIGVRLYQTEYVSTVGKEMILGKDLAGDIYAMLVFDLPDSIINVKPEQANKWNISFEELFETGIRNIKNKYSSEISQESFDEFKIWFVQGEHFFAPNIVLDLQNKKELIGSHGAIIGIPHRHAVIIYPIENIEVVKAINKLIPIIYGMNQEGPGSISNNIFWYKDGQFEVLPYKIEDNNLKFFPPEKFIELLNSLK